MNNQQPQQPTRGWPSMSNSALNDASLSSTFEAGSVRQDSRNGSLMRNIPPNSSFKEQKKSYNLKKKYFTKNIQSAIDSTQEVHSGWLKARTTFKRWTKVWCQVKPGYLIIYTSQEAQKKHRLGVVLLSVCQVIKRPTKKEGFCFKLINPFGYSVWAKSSTRALAFAQASLTLRASDASVGKLWLDALHSCNLSSNLDGYQPVLDEAFEVTESLRSNHSESSDSDDDGANSTRNLDSVLLSHSNDTSNNNSVLSLDCCQAGSGRPFVNGNALMIPKTSSSKNSHNNLAFQHNEFDDDKSLRNTITNHSVSRPSSQNNDCGNNSRLKKSASDQHVSRDQTPGIVSSMNSSKMVAKFSKYNWKELQLENVKYLSDGIEELGSAGIQSEEVHDSNKNFLWHIIKQLRPGMDLSKVTLPTFILEPRSFLEKLADYYYHCDILSEATLIDDPVMRLVNIVKWYLSGFYKKPKGPKKPYNPILGERFRCFWDHPKTQSRTFFIAEQVSHHPPISAFHVTNRKDGYTISCALLSRSKFGGNSVSAILDGKAKLYLNRRNETYTLTMPYANCRGILLGSLCMELGGRVEIECVSTGCKCELDFKLAPVWASSSSYNALTGKILKSNKVTHTLEGHWDKKITIVDKRTDEKSVLWEVTDTVRNSRLKRHTVEMNDQGERESVKLWSKVTEALSASDQIMATTEKTRLEDMQRKEARDRVGTFTPEHFVSSNNDTNEWSYRWQDLRSWDERRDIMQFEDNFKVKTLMLNTTSKSKSLDPNAIPNFDPLIDLPLTQLGRFANQIDELDETKDLVSHRPTRSSTNTTTRDETSPHSFRSIESKIEAENKLIKQAIKQVTDKNRELEEDLQTLKRGKKTAALVMAALIVALLSVFFRYFS